MSKAASIPNPVQYAPPAMPPLVGPFSELARHSPVEVALVHPQIPPNTGSIARTCAATQVPLHLVGPMGFDLSEKSVRRAGLDYWPYVPLLTHPSFESFATQIQGKRLLMFSAFAQRPYWEVEYAPGDILVFGSETKGLPVEVLESVPADQRLLIPMVEERVRGLNLSNCASLGLYEALRQLASQRLWGGTK